jgi:mRNA interferase RelE/StbE
MAWRVEIQRSALRELAALPLRARRRVDAAIRLLSENPRPPGARKLAGLEGLYRVRTGDYRIVYRVEDDVLLVLIVRIAHRRDACRRL